MKKELSYLKYLVPVLNIALGLQLFGFVIGLILLLIISVVGLDQIVSWGMTFAQQHLLNNMAVRYKANCLVYLASGYSG
ncbi:hypothetical protein [Streptococcus sp. E17BB]|uniref:hypothetical protein n=1 Tax=Streptococcus sp. E17BB TaxID=3278714 RepID=UPI00359DFD63